MCCGLVVVFSGSRYAFQLQVLPHVKRAGYNAIQLIGIVEHKDYFTAGYRVS